MKSIVMKAAMDVVLVNKEVPQKKKGKALLKLLYGGICGTDLSSYRGTMKYIECPRTPGHEFSAEIIEIDKNDKNLEKGIYVTANPYFNCGQCYPCRTGLVNCCQTNKTMGVQREGAFSEYITISIDRIYPTKNLSPKTIALVELFCISYHGIKRANIKAGENVLVLGAGTIGVLAAISALEKGANVTICDISKEKLEYVKHFGIQNIIQNVSDEAFIDEVKHLTKGNMFDVVVEAVGIPAAFQNCIDAVSLGGRMVQLGVGKSNVDFFFTSIQQKEITIIGSRNAVESDFVEVIDLLESKNVNIDSIITSIYPLKDISKAFEYFHQNVN